MRIHKLMVIASLVMTLSACPSDDETTLGVSVTSDFSPGTEIDSLEASFTTPRGSVIQRVPLTPTTTFPVNFVPVKASSANDEEVLVEVRALLAGQLVVEQKAIAMMLEGQATSITIELKRVCRSTVLACAAESTCKDGVCTAIRSRPGTDPQTSPDAALLDASEPTPDASSDQDSALPDAPIVCSANQGQDCGMCGGKVRCDGTCSAATPSNLGLECGKCGGTIQCDETCSKTTPTNIDEACGQCGGKIQCDGTCSKVTPPNFNETCGQCGGKIQCDGTCSKATPSDLGMSCGKCGGKVQCDGSCSAATPGNQGTPCGNCGGTVQCDGSCSKPDPANLGAACGSCGGKVQCDGKCSIDTPANYNAACGSCGGRIQCNGSCSVATPSNYNQSCGACGGRVSCNGTCSIATPSNYGQSCGCSGSYLCSGACSSPLPANYNTACGSCGGRWQCGGICSVPTPSNLNSTVVYGGAPYFGNFACCFINENRTYGGTCSAGYHFAGCRVSKSSGGGKVFINRSGGGRDCSCDVHIENVGLEGATYSVTIEQTRVCDNAW
ncbi:MAG: hypothetical protein SF187_06575 [Deltaproteobacteria bacterium]|nr:hypothetical protein [Deltaproteobacteria bacterium]